MNSLTPISYFAVWVHDIDAALGWYTTSFQCEVLHKDKVSALLQFQNCKVKLFLPSQQPPHIGFSRPDAGNFGELREQVDGAQVTFISDPSGSPVALVC